MEELNKMYKEAEEKLDRKGYHICNMLYNNNQFEVYNSDGEVVIDHLSLAQLKQLSEIL